METGSTISTETGMAGASEDVFSEMAMLSRSLQPVNAKAAIKAVKTIVIRVILVFI